jgi:hypothetical protein
MMSVPNVPTKKRRLSVMPKSNQKGAVTPQSPQSPLPSNNDAAEKQARHSKKTAAANENVVRNNNNANNNTASNAAVANVAVAPEPAKALDNAALAELYATCINMSTQNVS